MLRIVPYSRFGEWVAPPPPPPLPPPPPPPPLPPPSPQQQPSRYFRSFFFFCYDTRYTIAEPTVRTSFVNT
jgi:hypothetical protein